ncbi:unnamed protein product [Linum trigynum]|uniref:Uncharacterized protein n=1 Tax=Linum trigynum TaxID=586398 RepID=A0AAV2E7A0_9ROSI
MVTCNPSKDKAYALLKDQAKADYILKATFHAHVLLHYVHSTQDSRRSSCQKEKIREGNAQEKRGEEFFLFILHFRYKWCALFIGTLL